MVDNAPHDHLATALAGEDREGISASLLARNEVLAGQTEILAHVHPDQGDHMGQMKELMLEQMERGYSQMPGERYVCSACVTDRFVKEELDGSLEDEACAYCGTVPAADLLVLVDEIADYLVTEFEDPANSLPYVSREGGYQGVVDDGYDVVMDLDPWSDREDLVEDVATAFLGNPRCEKDYGTLKDDDILRYGWKRFSYLIKHHTRHLFFDVVPNKSIQDEGIPPSRMLVALGTLANDRNLFSILPKGSGVFRARVHDEELSLSTAEELGPPPREAAISSNRMSPAGISMFYGAFDRETALRETFDPTRDPKKGATVATFCSNRDLFMLDLTILPELPSPFDRANRHLRRTLSFLHEFVDDFSRPVARDGREHVDYVPTQVVTEFFRHRHRAPGNASIDGIVYTSSREGGDKAVVLFLSPEECGPRQARNSSDPEEVLSLKHSETLDSGAVITMLKRSRSGRSLAHDCNVDGSWT